MTPIDYLSFVAKTAGGRRSDYVAVASLAHWGHGPTLEAALAMADGRTVAAYYAFEPGTADLLACEAAGLMQVYYAWSRRDAQRFAVKLRPRGLQRVRKCCREYEPLWGTKPKPKHEPCPTSVIDFIGANCIRSNGARLLLKEFYDRFAAGLSGGERAHWTKRRVCAELRERGFPVKPGSANKRYIPDLLFSAD
jgi:hypothetical protein